MAECLLGTKAPNLLPSPLMFFKDSDLFQDELQLCWKYPCNSDRSRLHTGCYSCIVNTRGNISAPSIIYPDVANSVICTLVGGQRSNVAERFFGLKHQLTLKSDRLLSSANNFSIKINSIYSSMEYVSLSFSFFLCTICSFASASYLCQKKLE